MVNYKSLGDAVGMPDQKDKDFLRRLILDYNRRYPGLIKNTVDEARKDQRENSNALNDITRFGVVDGQSHRRHLFELPEGLINEIEMQYPTMFREKSHFHWFCKNFKELMLPEKF
jgi:hypothetical protein